MTRSRGVGNGAGTGVLTLSGGMLVYDLSGPADGPLVVCVHGMGDTRGSFRFLTPHLVTAGYRVVALDVRGHGQSTTGWADHSQRSIGNDLIALIRRLGGPATVIGSSSGAGSAIFTAEAMPDLVTGLVLISSFPAPVCLNPFMKVASQLVLHSPLLWTMYYRSLFPTTRPADFKQYTRALRERLREPGRMAAVRGIAEPGTQHWTRVADQIRCPVLIVQGMRDPDFPDPAAAAAASRQWLTSAASTAVAMIEDAGHYPHVDRPEATADHVVAFMDQCRA